MKSSFPKKVQVFLETVGRRGFVLFLVSLFVLYQGIAMTGAVPDPATAINLAVPLKLFTLSTWGSILTMVGMAGIVGSVYTKFKELALKVVGGFLYGWTFVYLISFFSHGGSFGAGSNTLLFGALALLLTIIAGWTEHGHKK